MYNFQFQVPFSFYQKSRSKFYANSWLFDWQFYVFFPYWQNQKLEWNENGVIYFIFIPTIYPNPKINEYPSLIEILKTAKILIEIGINILELINNFITQPVIEEATQQISENAMQ